jgi:hypothetical protein
MGAGNDPVELGRIQHYEPKQGNILETGIKLL